ncbi:hypothetical protein GTQ43_34000 [Nostoc sp. KVJ3]|uniref:hypothetical protein n=1 Tax=Nostoc sp. KVJ3 TaxID=457945 RepID=UPI0022379352|nr:hypothetical protein [Nostoc sp. KVJ3]MCW5318542.1 hypothetical protein [Nostoc sp. KVJ3]
MTIALWFSTVSEHSSHNTREIGAFLVSKRGKIKTSSKTQNKIGTLHLCVVLYDRLYSIRRASMQDYGWLKIWRC